MRLRRPTLSRLLAATMTVAISSSIASPALAKPAAAEPLKIDLPVESFTLDNGLRVYVVEDHSSPMFAMQIVYDVGSRDEETGRTGFAHLFEHMMFKGSQNVADGGHFKHVMGVGGQMNASTNFDWTNYFNILPSNYFDMGLWLEADRMRSLEVTDENFENQRAAVKEEKAMRLDNQPYIAAFYDFIVKAFEGATGYDHMPIGSLEDLNAAKTEDVRAFFNRYYAPNNAVLSIVGDVTLDEVKAKVQQYFGDIPRGQDKVQPKLEPKKRTEPLALSAEDDKAQLPAYVIGWQTVEQGHKDAYAIELLGNILLRGESSRITKILKDEKELVIQSMFFPLSLRYAGAVMTLFIPTEGGGFEQIKGIVREELTKVQKSGITKKELDKAINQKVVDTVEELETDIGRAMSIGMGAMMYDDAKFGLTELERYRAVTPDDIKRVANEYFGDNWMTLEIKPKTAAGAPGMPKM